MYPVWIVLSVLVTLGGAERFACRGRILGAYYADSKSGCKAFHVCVRVAGGGIRDFRFFCPPGTLFHQEAQTCTDWGDDDPLACPPDLYDGSFDLYKIGSGYDTKKVSAQAPRDEEPEFGLQRAETGDRRLQNNGASDLRAAHSSDFFSGQRDRGRDDSPASAPSSPATSSSRQSFRRPTTARTSPPPTTQYTTTPPTPAPQSPKQYTPQQYTPQQYTPQQYTPQQFTPKQYTPQQYTPQQSQKYTPQQSQQYTPQQSQKYTPQQLQQYTPQQSQQYTQKQSQQYTQKQLDTSSKRKLLRKRPVHTPPPTTYAPSPAPTTYAPSTSPPQQTFQDRRQQQQQYRSTTTAPANVPPQYKDEYVEVSRVTPKQTKFYSNTGSPVPFSISTTAAPFSKKEGLVELFNYDSQSTPAVNIPNRPFKVRNSFSVTPDFPQEQDFVRTKILNSNSNNGRNAPSTVDYNTTPRITTANQAYKNYNSVSYEPEKNNFLSQSGAKQNYNYFNSPSSTPSTTTYYTTVRADPPSNFNTAAYNTNNGINTGSGNFVNSDEDDGQYRPPRGEDDGQYRPELYERERETELLSGAHSLNIAASGNRLPEDQKQFGKGQQNFKPVAQTEVPRPFRPAPTPTSPSTAAPESTTTFRPQTVNTQRTFDYFQTYTTTSAPVSQYVPLNSASTRPQTTQAVSKTSEPVSPRDKPQTRPPAPPSVTPTKPPKPTTRAPHFSHPANNKEDTSYDYAYYDSDPGFSEYDPIEEFGKTKTKH